MTDITKDNYFKFLMIHAQKGSKNPFLELADIYKKDIFIRALQLTANIEYANKITSEVFLKVWENIKLFSETTPFEVWIKGITVNMAILLFRDTHSDGSDNETLSNSEIVCVNELDEKFLSLDRTSREILILHDLEGYSLEDYVTLLEKNDIEELTKKLKDARKIFCEDKTINILESYSEEEWSKVISDFDLWNFEEIPNNDYTSKLKILRDHREKIASLLNGNYPNDDTFKLLMDSLVSDGESVATERKKKEANLKQPVSITPKAKQKKKLNEITKIFAKPDGKDEFRKVLRQKRKKKQNKSYGYLVFAAILIIIVGSYFYLGDSYPWKISNNSKNYLINSIKGSYNLNKGDILKTEKRGRVEVVLDAKARIELDENSAILCLEDYENIPTVKFQYGRIKINTKSPDNLRVLVGSFIVTDRGAISEIYIDHQNRGSIHVDKGKLLVSFDGVNIPLIKNYKLNMDSFIPFYIKQTVNYKSKVSLLKNPITDDEQVNFILNNSTANDALTLWMMIKLAEKRFLNSIIFKLESLYPLPNDVTRRQILAKNNESMQKWFESFVWQLR